MTKLQVKNKNYYYEVNSKPNVDIIGITVFMWKQPNFETIFASEYVQNMQCSNGKGFRSIERALFIWINAYFVTTITNIPHATPNYGPGQSKFEIYYYRKTHCFTKTLVRIWENL